MSTFRLMQFASGVSSFDRFLTPALLVTMSDDLGASLSVTSNAATLYFVLYAATQPVWAVVSDRVGRVTVLRTALLAAGCSGVVCALADSIGLVIAARALTGGLLAAVVPTALVWVGDTFPDAHRRPLLTRILAATYVGTLAASLVAAGAAQLRLWPAAVTVSAAGALAVGIAFTRVPGHQHPERPTEASRGALWHPQVLLVLTVGFLEGAAVHGTLTYWPVTLESLGASAGLAGLAVGCFGVGVIVGSRVVGASSRSRRTLVASGGAMICLALVSGAVARDLGVVPTLVAAGILGAGFAALHSSLQSWATTVAPSARALAVAFFVTAMFAGSAAGAALGAPVVASGRFEMLYLAAALVMVPVTVVAARRPGY